jgi:hypothetical protein
MCTKYELINETKKLPKYFDSLEAGSCFMYGGNLFKKIELVLATGRRWAVNLPSDNGNPVEFSAETTITPVKKVVIHYEI